MGSVGTLSTVSYMYTIKLAMLCFRYVITEKKLHDCLYVCRDGTARTIVLQRTRNGYGFVLRGAKCKYNQLIILVYTHVCVNFWKNNTCLNLV